MMSMRGKPSLKLRSAHGRPDIVATALAVLGVAASLGLIAISALLNFRMGLRSADTAFDGYVYGLGAAFGDVLKAISPFMAYYGLRNRDWLAVSAASGMYLVFTGYSFFAALGFAAEHRTTKAAEALNGIETRQDLRAALKRDSDAIDAIGLQRSSLEVEAAISKQGKLTVGPRNRTVQQVSDNCTLNREATREACAEIAVLAEELARARKREALVASVETVRTMLTATTKGSAADSADPQVDAVKKVVAVIKDYDNRQIGFGLSVLLALFVELGSGLGLFVATTPWRSKREPQSPQQPEANGPPQSGRVEVYVLEHLEPDPRGEVRMSELYTSYQRWCWGRGQEPHAKGEFRKQFADIAKEVGMRSLRRNGQDHFQQLRLGTRK